MPFRISFKQYFKQFFSKAEKVADLFPAKSAAIAQLINLILIFFSASWMQISFFNVQIVNLSNVIYLLLSNAILDSLCPSFGS